MDRPLHSHGRKAARRHFAILIGAGIFLALQFGCAQIRLPAIDPSGNRIFLPRPFSTTLTGSENNPLRRGNPPAVQTFPNALPAPPVNQGPFGAAAANAPVIPAFQNAPDAPPCDQPLVSQKQHIIPHPRPPRSDAARGKIITTPHRIVAPVGSEVVVLAGICGGDGRFALNQPLEWMLSNDSVGQLIEVGGTSSHPTFNRIVPPTARKFDGQYAWGRTGLKDLLLTRGTPTPADDIQLLKGQTFASVSSESPGTTYVTTVAPKAAGWDRRRSTTQIHWVDGIWSIPLPTSATSGTVHPLTTKVSKASGSGGVPDWKVRYTIVGGAPSEFVPTGSQTAEAVTGQDGLATVQIRQQAGEQDPGATQVRVDVIRPRQNGEPELIVESGITTVNWSAPALTIRAVGPKLATVGQPFNYIIEVTNPGDQVARGVKVRTRDLGSNIEFISSSPKPTQYGNSYEWELGNIDPKATPEKIEIQLSADQPGNSGLCFDVFSESDGLQTQACAQTEITNPCIGLDIEGPTVAKVGQEVDFNIIIANQCNESLKNLELVVRYDARMKAMGGLQDEGLGNPIRYNINSIGVGQREEVELSFQILEPGRLCFDLAVTADSENLDNSAQSRICVTATPAVNDNDAGGNQGQDQGVDQGDAGPDSGTGSGNSVIPNAPLQLSVTGQSRIQYGDTALVRSIVRNNTTQPINNIFLTFGFPPSMYPNRLTQDYTQGWLGSDLAFDLGTLNPGEEALVEVEFDSLQPDRDAFAEVSVTTPNNDIGSTQRFEIDIQPASGGAGEPPIRIPNDGGQGGQLPQGPTNPTQPQTTPRDPGNNPQPTTPGDEIRIPGDNQGSLGILVRPQSRSVTAGDEFNVSFTVTNRRNSTDENITIVMLIPPSLRLVGFDDSQWGLPIEFQNGDFTEFTFQTRNQMRPGEEITYIASLRAVQQGVATVEMEATSDKTVGTVRGSENVFVQ